MKVFHVAASGLVAFVLLLIRLCAVIVTLLLGVVIFSALLIAVACGIFFFIVPSAHMAFESASFFGVAAVAFMVAFVLEYCFGSAAYGYRPNPLLRVRYPMRLRRDASFF